MWNVIKDCFAVIGLIASLIVLAYLSNIIRDYWRGHKANTIDRQTLLEQRKKWATVPVEER